MRVVFDGFKDREHALAFISWYEGGGEQQFDDHADIAGVPSAFVDVSHKGNTGRYWDEHSTEIKAFIK